MFSTILILVLSQITTPDSAAFVEFRKTIDTIASQNNYVGFMMLCEKRITVEQYIRGDDRLFANHRNIDDANMLFRASGADRVLLYSKGYVVSESNSELKVIVGKLLSLIDETLDHQINSGFQLTIGHLLSQRFSGVTGRAASNLEWVLDTHKDANGKLHIRRIIVAMHS